MREEVGGMGREGIHVGEGKGWEEVVWEGMTLLRMKGKREFGRMGREGKGCK